MYMHVAMMFNKHNDKFSAMFIYVAQCQNGSATFVLTEIFWIFKYLTKTPTFKQQIFTNFVFNVQITNIIASRGFF